MPRSALLTLLFCCAAASWAETSAPSPSPAPRSIITGPIDESRLVTLRGNTTAAARHANNDRGAVADDLVFDHLLLTLQPPPESEARLESKTTL